MNPREIEVHIEELVLHGFDAGARVEIETALSARLSNLLSDGQTAEQWLSRGDRSYGATINTNDLSDGRRLGNGVAEAILRGDSK